MKYISLALVIGFSAPIFAEEIEPPCAHASLQGKWVGPEAEMNLDDECHGTSGSTKFDYATDASNLKIGDKDCKIFQRANELALECDGEQDARLFHRYNHVVHK